MKTLLRRLRYFVGRDRMARELAEELDLHRELTERRLRDDGAEDAAAASRRVMGNSTLAREDARAVWMGSTLDGIRQDVMYALRVMRHAPGFAAAMVLVMALGIGATTAVFSLVDGLVLRSLPVHEPERLVYFARPSFSYRIFQEVKARAGHVFSTITAWDLDGRYVAWHTELEPAEVMLASGEFYATVGIGAVAGRTFGPEDDRIGGGPHGLVAVMSHAAWQRRFNGDPSAIGRTIRIDEHTFTIVGVTPPGFFGVAPGLAPELTIPLTSLTTPQRLAATTASNVHLLGRLRDDVSHEAANAALQTFWPAALAATVGTGDPPERRAMYLSRQTSLEPGSAGYSRVRNQFGDPLWLLLGLVALLLTVACASAANLLLARGISRHREIAIRLAIGAGRRRLVRQLLTESLVWTILGAAAGLVLALWGAGTLVALMTTTEEQIALDLSLNWRILVFSLMLAFATAAICAVMPALGATRIDPNASLKETGQIGANIARGWSTGRALVAAQVALTVVLLFGAALFFRSLTGILSQDAGFERDRLLILSTDPEAAGRKEERLTAFYDALLERLPRIPGVQSASVSLYPPISDEDGAWTRSISTDGNPVPDAPGQATVYFNMVSPGYFGTTGISLVRGRDFNPTDTRTSPHVVIVNEALARRHFAGQDPIGRQVTIGRHTNRQNLTIVGIVRTSKYQRLQEEPRSIAYLPHRQHTNENLFTEIRLTNDAAVTLDAIRREVRAVDPVAPLRMHSADDRIRESLVTERVLVTLASTLGGAALVLACAGLYGMLAYAVSRRTREIGLRLALGAERRDVIRDVMAQSLSLAGIGVAVGIAASLTLGRYTRTLLYAVSPADPISLAASAAVMVVVAILAAFLPARRAAAVDPVVALRMD